MAITILNFTILIVIIMYRVKFFRSTTKMTKSNGDIEKKLDKIVELLEKMDKKN
jgi:membrane protein insertase Oxa1/YidC/SpoIIIJ